MHIYALIMLDKLLQYYIFFTYRHTVNHIHVEEIYWNTWTVFKLSASFEFVACLLTSTIPAELKQPTLPWRILYTNTTTPFIFHNHFFHGLGSKHPVKSKNPRKIDCPHQKYCSVFLLLAQTMWWETFFFPQHLKYHTLRVKDFVGMVLMLLST